MSLDVKWTDLKDIAFFRLKILSIKTEYDNEWFVILSKTVDVLMVHKTDIRCMSYISYPTKCFLRSSHCLRPINFPLKIIGNISARRFDAHVLAKMFSMKPFRKCAGVFNVTPFPHDHYIVTVIQARIRGLLRGCSLTTLIPILKCSMKCSSSSPMYTSCPQLQKLKAKGALGPAFLSQIALTANV